MRRIRVIIKHPGQKPYVTNVSDSLGNLQSHVDGYIETVTLASDLVIICNEEGRLRGLPYNCRVCGVDFVGTILFAGVNGDEFDDLPISFKDFKAMFPDLWKED